MLLLRNPPADFIVGDMVLVWDAKQSSEASHFYCLDPPLLVCIRCACLACIQITEMTSARWSFTLVPREMFLSLHMVFSLAIAVAVWAALARISIFDRSSLMIFPRYLKWSSVSSSFLLTVFLVVIGWALFAMNLVFSALISMPYREDASSSCFTRLASSSSFPARPSVSSANLWLMIVHP